MPDTASGWSILSDFDGTISETDASQLVLRKYGEGQWVSYDELLERDEITFEACIAKQFRLINASVSKILSEYDQFVIERRGFGALVRYAAERAIPITIVSGGLKFMIERFLERNGWASAIGLHVGELEVERGRMAVTFPPLEEEGSLCFKDDLVLRLKRRGDRVVYIGDGSYDFVAARASDMAFAVRGSKLARLCHEKGVPFTEFQEFSEVVRSLASLLG